MPLPRWYRHRCEHENRVEFVAGGQVYRDFCQDCGAEFPVTHESAPAQP